jgi:hypothetical protein
VTFDITKIGGVLDRVKTPLTLGGLVVIVLYGIYSQILKLNIFPQLPAASAFVIIRDIIGYLFWLAVLAVILGVGSYLAVHFVTQLKPIDVDGAVPLKPVRKERKKKDDLPTGGGQK